MVLIETVGAGQSEVDVARLAQTTLVVEAPGLGDDVQAIKAGILEIADILVVNKADRPGLENTVRALRAMLDLGHRTEQIAHHGRLMSLAPLTPLPDENTAWQPTIVQTIAAEEKGITELVTQIAAHRQYLIQTGVLAARERATLEVELSTRLRDSLLQHLLASTEPAVLRDMVERVAARRLTPAAAAQALVAQHWGGS
jgi:LAO/AO transport system kinase